MTMTARWIEQKCAWPYSSYKLANSKNHRFPIIVYQTIWHLKAPTITVSLNVLVLKQTWYMAIDFVNLILCYVGAKLCSYCKKAYYILGNFRGKKFSRFSHLEVFHE